MSIQLVLPRRGRNREEEMIRFAVKLKEIGRGIGFKISPRGWCYQLEGFRLINKDQFDRVENAINECREKGYLPIDFVAEEEGRKFSGVETPEDESPIQYMRKFLNAALRCESWYTPDWWDGEEYYIQMLVEKIDIKTLFKPICEEYHIPIATSKGWSSMLQRGEYARRFKDAEDKDLKCVLLYCGDHDPDGLRISEFIRSNLDDLKEIVWEDGTDGYDPEDLIIKRFGLNYDFIVSNSLTWIDNLITGSGKNLASPTHPNYLMIYVQDYLRDIGERKCEANALVVRPEEGRQLCREAVEGYLGPDALGRFREKRVAVERRVADFRERTGLRDAINEALRLIDEDKEGEE